MNEDNSITKHLSEQKVSLNPREKTEILRQRAKLLAHESGQEKEHETFIEVVEFLLNSEHYAVETAFVRELYQLKEITPLPCTPSFVLGVTNVRGHIVSVIDIRKFFDLPSKGLGDLNKLIILQSSEMVFGILADKVLGTRSIAQEEIQSSLPTLTDKRARYTRGVTGERLVILDAGKILSDKSIIVHEEIET